MKCEQDIKSTGTSKEQKTIALKFLIHFIGDCHQPMHVSRAEDKGGNSIQVSFDGRNTNLHSLWDSGLINKQGESIAEMSKADDKTTPEEIKEWQGQPAMQWLWESYQISTQLYAEVDEDKNSFSDAYYGAHIGIVNKRMEQAGIRLAGVLNTILAGNIVNDAKGSGTEVTTTAGATISDRTLPSNEAHLHLGEKVKIVGKVYGGKFLANTGLTLLDIGGHYPRQDLTVAIPKDVPFSVSIGKLTDKTITVEGLVVDYRGKPEIEITDYHMLTIID